MGLVAKAFQDIITFSRASSGTYVNSNGYITNSSVLNYLTYSNQPENAAWTKSNSFVQQNLLTYSEDFTNVNWVTTNVAAPTANTTIAPDGTLTADTLTASAGAGIHNVNQNTAVSLTPVTLSIYLKAGTYGFVQLFHGANSAYYANFNLSTGVLGTVGGSASATITAAPNGFYRCTLTITPSAASAFRVAFISSATAVYNENWTAAGTETFYAWGSQLVQGSVPGDYRATTSAALPCLYADYNGALRARKLCEDSATSTHISYQSPTPITANTRYVQSVYAKAGERNWMWMTEANNVTATAYFDLANGVVGTVSGTGSPSATITLIGNGWYRCMLAFTPIAAAANVQVRLANGDNSGTYAGNGSSGIYIADAQLNDGSSALAYYDTTASAYNAPRFDYDPVTLAAKGLLVEESRANLLLYSNAFTTAPWTVRGTATATPNAALSPDGTNNAWLIAGINVLTNDVFQQITVASGVAYSPSFYIKKVTATGTLQVANPAGTNGTMNINLALLGSGWERITTSHPAVTVTTAFAGSAGNAGGLHLLAPTTGPLSFYLYGSQCELGAFSTSYIPTVASQVTRAADVASVNTLSPWFNQVGGTIYVEALHGAIPSGAALPVEIGDGTNDNRHAIFTAGSAFASYYVFVGGVSQATISASAFTANVVGKFAAAYAANDFQTAGNGTLGGSDASGSLPTNLNKMFIGNNIGSTSFWNGWLRRITYYPRRLTNAELQTLTTL